MTKAVIQNLLALDSSLKQDLPSNLKQTLTNWLLTGRSRLAAPLSGLPTNLGRTLAGWLWMGGAALHDLPGRPIYDPAMGFLLLVGTAIALWKASW